MESGVSRPVALAIGVAIVLLLGVLGFWLLTPKDKASLSAGLTEVKDPSEIKRTVELSHVGILTSTNFLGHRVYQVVGTLKNTSSMPLRLIDAKMTFFGYDKKSIHEEVHSAYSPKQKPLNPGGEYRFEIAFENPPRTWNYHVPDTEVVRAAY